MKLPQICTLIDISLFIKYIYGSIAENSMSPRGHIANLSSNRSKSEQAYMPHSPSLFDNTAYNKWKC